YNIFFVVFFFSSRRRHTRLQGDWSSDVCSSDLSFEAQTRESCKRIVNAMIAYPELIGGTTKRLDTELMRVGRGRFISKIGAEGRSEERRVGKECRWRWWGEE